MASATSGLSREVIRNIMLAGNRLMRSLGRLTIVLPTLGRVSAIIRRLVAMIRFVLVPYVAMTVPRLVCSRMQPSRLPVRLIDVPVRLSEVRAAPRLARVTLSRVRVLIL